MTVYLNGRHMKFFTSLTLIFFTIQSWAQPVPDSPPKEHELQLGVAAVSSDSIYIGGSSQSQVFPAIDYQYKRFYIQAGDFGVNLIDEKNWEIDFGLGVNLVGDTDRGESRLLNNLPSLSYPVNAFLSAQYKTSIGLFKIKYNHEINNKHNGNNSSISYAAPIFRGKWLFMPQIAYEYHSAEVVNYFFGITPEYATNEFQAYQSGSATAYQLSVLALYEMNEKWSFVGNIQTEKYSDEITNSPIVSDDQRTSVFAGLLYKFF